MGIKYNCKIIAAYMAQYHGMKFKSPRGQNLYYDGGADFRAEKDCGIYAGEYYYIHPDSLHLLEPQENDVGMDSKGNLMVFLDGRWRDWGNDEWTLNRPHKIIQRSDKPFHWPESEEA